MPVDADELSSTSAAFFCVAASSCRTASPICAMPRACSCPASLISLMSSITSSTRCTVLATRSPAWPTRVDPRSTPRTLAAIRPRISRAAVLLRWDSPRTSPATTAKPRPCSPARAASTAALRASRLVWNAMSSITLMMSVTFCDCTLISCMVVITSRITLPPSLATLAASWASSVARWALSVLCCTVMVSCSIEAAVSWRLDACTSVRRARSSVPPAISTASCATVSVLERTSVITRTSWWFISRRAQRAGDGAGDDPRHRSPRHQGQPGGRQHPPVNGVAHLPCAGKLCRRHVDLQGHQLLDGVLHLGRIGADLVDIKLGTIVVLACHQCRGSRDETLVQVGGIGIGKGLRQTLLLRTQRLAGIRRPQRVDALHVGSQRGVAGLQVASTRVHQHVHHQHPVALREVADLCQHAQGHRAVTIQRRAALGQALGTADAPRSQCRNQQQKHCKRQRQPGANLDFLKHLNIS